jgi:outer membrane receptor protein involved in Fe transport
VPAYFPLSLDQQLGNPSLKSESAKTWTVGTVLKSPWQHPLLSRLTASVDYYNISISGAIAPLSSQIIYQECLNGFPGSNPNYDPNNPYCQLIIRSPAGFTSTVLAKFTNLGSIETSGIDAQLDWSTDVQGLGIGGNPATIFANINFNWLQSYDVVTAPGGTVIHYAGTVGGTIGTPPYGAQFRWKLYSTLGYHTGPATLSMSWMHYPSAKNIALATNPASTTSPTPSYDKFDLAGSWAINATYLVRAGIDNLFDIGPPIVGAVPGVTSAAGLTDVGSYDVMGRRFYIGLKARF